MTLRSIAFNNLCRRKGRSLFLVAGLLIGIAAVVALLSITSAMAGEAKTSMQSFGANVLITPATKSIPLTYGGISVGGLSVGAQYISQDVIPKINAVPLRREIAEVAPELVASVRANGRPALIMGVRPVDEFRLKKWWSLGAGRLPATDHEVVVGSAAATALGLQMGDYVRIAGRRFTVTGLLHQTGSQEDRLIIAELGEVQSLVHEPGRLSMVEIAALSSRSPIAELAGQLASVLPGTKVAAMQEAVKSSQRSVSQFRSFSFALVGVVIAIEAIVVFVTMMASVSERTREIGVFRAIGFTGSHIVRLVLIEAAVASALAGALGYLAGMGTAYAVVPALARSAHIAWTPALALLAMGLSLTVGAAASLYPALHASRLDPTEALRAL